MSLDEFQKLEESTVPRPKQNGNILVYNELIEIEKIYILPIVINSLRLCLGV